MSNFLDRGDQHASPLNPTSTPSSTRAAGAVAAAVVSDPVAANVLVSSSSSGNAAGSGDGSSHLSILSHIPPLPPPPPPPPLLQQQQQQQTTVQRLRLPTLTTSLSSGGSLDSHLRASATPTPASAVNPSFNSSFAPTTESTQSLASPVSATTGIASLQSMLRTSHSASLAAMNSYNPQEWGRGTVGGAYLPHSTASGRSRRGRDLTGLEAAMPSPPPPYSRSPSSAQHASPHSSVFTSQTSPINNYSDYNSPLSAATSVSSGAVSAFSSHRPVARSQQTSPTSFPPPPGPRDRSASRTKGMFSALASRVRAPDTSSSPSQSSDATVVINRSVSTATAVAAQSRPMPCTIDLFQPPPTTRRAASVGAIGPDVMQGRSRAGTNDSVWEPGMPLPPPPPLGPPPSSRSQSLNRASARDQSGNIYSPVPTRIVARPSQLETVPPTPADFVDEQPAQSSSQGGTASVLSTTANASSPSNNIINTDNVFAARTTVGSDALRAMPSFDRLPRSESKTRGSIRDRRSEARARSKEPMTAVEPRRNPWDEPVEQHARPADLILSLTNNTSSTSSSIARRPHVSKSQASPRGFTSQPLSAESISLPQQPLERSTIPNRGTPSSAPLQQHHGFSVNPSPISPPFSADNIAVGADAMRSLTPSRLSQSQSSTSLVEPIPTPSSATQNRREYGVMSSARTSISEQGGRSQGRQTPLNESHAQALYRPTSKGSSSNADFSKDARLDAFALASLNRFKVFIDAEAQAGNDRERLEMFAGFFVNESRLRRDRYYDAFDSMGSDVLDLTRDMWRSHQIPSSKRTSEQPEKSTPQLKTAARRRSTTPGEPSSAGSNSGSAGAPYTPKTEPDSPGSAQSQGRYRSDSHRQASYQPMLSPIPSMAMSTVPDEDSRGRPSSRWWEQSSVGGNSIADGGVRKIARSKRESKYMGVPREARAYLQWDQSAEPSPSFGNVTPGPSDTYHNLGPNEYPPEKIGWHEPQQETASRQSGYITQTPRTPQPSRLDMSRLITLPPPYPRHHPAVNNSHPALSAIRQTLRSLTERGDEAQLRENYQSQRPRSPFTTGTVSSLADRRREMRMHIQEQVTSGRISFADAAKAEADFEEIEVKRSREAAQKDFDAFQTLLLSPLCSSFSEKITKSTASIEYLSSSLVDEARNRDPTLTQEEGDEEPELLEKLTLMKWFFEAREQLHKDLFDLQGESDDKYKQVILAPYRLTSNTTKIAEVDTFFIKDSRDRKIVHETKARQRFEAFLKIIESSVTRGVEDQLSAFWDIAPPLLEIVLKVPVHLQGFEIYIPPDEVEENPSYVQHPMQYLYTLLVHAQKSAYQFIEAQTNLLCLLHEVKTGVMVAGCRLMESQRYIAGEDFTTVEREMQVIRADEDIRLTRDLKERVKLAEDQWKDALGKGLGECKKHLERWLVESGGWDESLVE